MRNRCERWQLSTRSVLKHVPSTLLQSRNALVVIRRGSICLPSGKELLNGSCSRRGCAAMACGQFQMHRQRVLKSAFGVTCCTAMSKTLPQRLRCSLPHKDVHTSADAALRIRDRHRIPHRQPSADVCRRIVAARRDLPLPCWLWSRTRPDRRRTESTGHRSRSAAARLARGRRSQVLSAPLRRSNRAWALLRHRSWRRHPTGRHPQPRIRARHRWQRPPCSQASGHVRHRAETALTPCMGTLVSVRCARPRWRRSAPLVTEEVADEQLVGSGAAD